MTFAKFLHIADVVMYANVLWIVKDVIDNTVTLVHTELHTVIYICGDVKVFKV